MDTIKTMKFNMNNTFNFLNPVKTLTMIKKMMKNIKRFQLKKTFIIRDGLSSKIRQSLWENNILWEISLYKV